MIDMFDKTRKAIEAEDRIRQAYRSVFAGEQGRLVLEDMLYNLKFVTECRTEQDMALSNYAKSLLATIYGVDIDTPRLFGFIKRIINRKTENKT